MRKPNDRLRFTVALGVCLLVVYVLVNAGCYVKEVPYEHKLDNYLAGVADAVSAYCDNNDNVLPSAKDPITYERVLDGYLKTGHGLRLPDSNLRYAVNPSVSGMRIKDIALPAFTVVLYEPEFANDHTIGFVTVEGNKGRADEGLWHRLRKISHIPEE